VPNRNNPACFSSFVTFVNDEISGWRLGELLWLSFCLSSILSLSIYWHDSFLGVLAALSGMMYTVLAGKGKVSCYLFGIINTPIYAWLSWIQGYYGDMVLNMYYFVMMFPGFLLWSRNGSQVPGKGVVKTKLSVISRIVWGGGIFAGALILWPVIGWFGGTRPLCDAFTNVLSVAAMMLTLRRCIEQWILWIAVDAIEVFMWWRAWETDGGSVLVLLMWLLFLANGIYLLRLWMRR
jgi:nicotinamide mononucleotide transporter